MTAAQEFVEFATTASPRLRRMAFLLCGDWHAAEDLVADDAGQGVRVLAQDQAAATRSTPTPARTLVNSYLADKRR